MVKRIIPAITFIFLLGSCSSLKQLGLSGNKPVTTSASLTPPQDTPPVKKEEIKFIDNITVSPQTSQNNTTDVSLQKGKGPESTTTATTRSIDINNSIPVTNTVPENIAAIQAKYAILLNTDVEQVQNLKLFEYIDDWYGTRYCMGGTTKNCIDCSAFVQSLFSAIYGITLPRTSKYQYTATRRISTTELKEGDLLFFHTRRNRRGVTHVGIYLQNNKFVHASSSGGVKISDMYEPYYVQHLIGAGRAKDDR